MAGLRLVGVTKRFGSTTAVDAVSLEVHDHELLVLVGPSGCGKSTLLRLIAGLEPVTGGEIFIGDRRVNDVAARDRDVAMVFQSYALYPHMDVLDNMAFALKLAKAPAGVIRERVDAAARILDIGDLLGRKPAALSGGQRQRVALGRAIVRHPAVFLLDEPLSNLDALLRVQTRAELGLLHRRLGATFVYVTHDQVEAMTLAQRIAVLDAGRLQQVGPPRALYEQPANRFVAGFIGSPAMNFADLAPTADEGGDALVGPGLRLPLPPARRAQLERAGLGTVVAGVRPEHIHARAGPLPPGAVPIDPEVRVVEYLGHESLVHFELAGAPFIARVPADAAARPGEPFPLAVDAGRLHLFDPTTGTAL